MDEEIKITVRTDPNNLSFKLIIDRPIYPQGSIYFPNKEKAKGVPFIEKIFDVQNVTAVRIAGTELTIVVDNIADWKILAKKIAEIVRTQIHSGQPSIPPDFKHQTVPDTEIRQIVKELLDKQINPAVGSHGGFINLIDVKENKVYLQLQGGCHGCGMANVTLKQGIETAIRERIPDIDDVLDVTDHAGGTNPYYMSRG